jgi:hypothetical protein
MSDQTSHNETDPMPAVRPERPMATAAAAVVVALLVGVGIGYVIGSGTDGTDTPAQTQAAPDDPEKTPAAEETTEPADEASATPVALGDEVDLTALKVTVFDYKKDLAGSDGSTPEDGNRWDAALVKACNVSLTEDDGRDLIANFDVWGLNDSDDGRFGELDLTPSPAPEPQWQSFKKLNADQCTKGWVVFDLPEDAAPTSVVYSFNGEDEATWVLK